jgi:hypothetical protein
MIRQDEVILRAKQFIFHLDCFTCITCNVLLHPGKYFYLQNSIENLFLFFVKVMNLV